ncbi:MAG: DNA mismatch endonuclease Vsr, partial [Prevotellaceae bacterium]|nr:DNA mismatch endonuclease Vsr [Prevotellaceae bacterium]
FRSFGKETKPEIFIRKFLFANGFRYRKNVRDLPGKPDIVLPKYKTTIFIHGCFWHGHDCKRGGLPESNFEFWKEKIGNNIERDKRNIVDLKQLGWNVIVIWQCEIRNIRLREGRLEKLISELHYIIPKT